MRNISILILLMICLSSLLLTGCEQVGITPAIDSGNLEYQGEINDTETVDTIATEGAETVSKIKIDKRPPVVTITLPGTGKYALNQSITATWSATDALSGVVSPVSGLVLIDTSSVGTKTLTLPAGTAKDKAGNLSLQVTKSYSVIEEPIEETGTESSQKWSGLTGFDAWYGQVDGSADTWLVNGFTEWRGLRDYTNAGEVNGSKTAVIAGNIKGLKAIWGVGSGGTTITSTNWVDFRQAILDAAMWAQDNGVYEFQLGNEEEYHVDGTTMTVTQIIINLKSVATDVQGIFTNGKVSYTCWQNTIDDWAAVGKGDIDILASNIYIGGEGYYSGNEWKSRITNMVNAFGVDGTYITEFGPSYSSLDDFSTDEAVQAEGVAEMIEYIKASGIERALFYCWQDYPGGLFGVVKDDGTYRELWSQTLLNSESVKFATVPIKTTTASLHY